MKRRKMEKETDKQLKMLGIKTDFTILLIFVVFILWAGATQNMGVVEANGGRMPVKNYNINNTRYFGFTNDSEVTYPLLTDRHILSFGGEHIWFYSTGDAFLFLSACLFCFTAFSTYYRIIKWKREFHEPFWIRWGE